MVFWEEMAERVEEADSRRRSMLAGSWRRDALWDSKEWEARKGLPEAVRSSSQEDLVELSIET